MGKSVPLEPNSYIGSLKILSFAGMRNKSHYYKVECFCGNVFITQKKDLVSGRTRSCPSCSSGAKLRDLENKNWQVLHKAGKDHRGRILWRCVCRECGALRSMTSSELKAGNITCDHVDPNSVPSDFPCYDF